MQTVSTPFATMSTASVQDPAATLRISWLRRKNTSASFAEVGKSVVDGVDIVQGEFTSITPNDLFTYSVEDNRIIDLRIDQFVEEPLGGLSYSLLNCNLENTDNRFTPNFNSTIGTALLPKRPVKVGLGFNIGSVVKALPQFKGIISERPREQKGSSTLSFKARDYISILNEFQLESTIYQDQTSDQIIADILQDAGFNSTQYSLDTGLNTIGFAWFKKGDTAGNAIRKLCQAEEAHFYQDENGQIIFENRRTYNNTPYTNTQHTVDASDIIDWRDDLSIDPINRCVVKANPRAVQSTSTVWTNGIVERIDNNEVKVIWASFDNPVTSIVTPASTTDYVANSAIDGSGTDQTDNITVSVDRFTEDAKITITNNSGGRVYLTKLELRGTPATITSEIREIYQDDDAINKFGEVNELVIENDFIDSESFAYYLARTIVRKYKDPVRRARITIPAVPQLQLKDKISVQDRDLGTYADYRIMGITHQINGPSYLMILNIREITDAEADSPATVGTSTVDGDDVVWI